MQKMWVLSLGQEHPLEKQMATHSGILAWKIPWMEEPGQGVGMGGATVLGVTKESDMFLQLNNNSNKF